MQYLLNHEEMDEIQELRRLIREKLPSRSVEKHLITLRSVCQSVADAIGYGCIHSQHEGFGYCDNCPVQDICPLPKEWSK